MKYQIDIVVAELAIENIRIGVGRECYIFHHQIFADLSLVTRHRLGDESVQQLREFLTAEISAGDPIGQIARLGEQERMSDDLHFLRTSKGNLFVDKSKVVLTACAFDVVPIKPSRDDRQVELTPDDFAPSAVTEPIGVEVGSNLDLLSFSTRA